MSQAETPENWSDSSFNRAWVFRLSHLVCRLLPRDALYALAEGIFDWYQAWKPEAPAAVIENLRIAFPDRPREEVEALASRTFTNYALSMVDYLRAGFDPPTVLPADPETAGRISGSTGRILVAAHMGSWEIGGARLSEVRGRHWMVGVPEQDQGVAAFRESKRQTSGHVTIMAGSSALTPIRLRRALEMGENVVVLVERASKRDRVEVSFRGRRAWFLRSPALFSALSGAPIVPMAVVREGPALYRGYAADPYFAKAGQEGSREAMQYAADFFSGILERYPDQWYNFYRYWQEAP